MEFCVIVGSPFKSRVFNTNKHGKNKKKTNFEGQKVSCKRGRMCVTSDRKLRDSV